MHLMVDLMLHLKGHLRVYLKSNWRCTKRCQKGCTWCVTWLCTKVWTYQCSWGCPSWLIWMHTYIWGLNYRWCWGYNWVTLEDTNGDAHVSANECTKWFNKMWTWGDTLCCTWRCTWDFTLRTNKNFRKKCEEKINLRL